MSSAPEKLAALRHLIAERFPTASRREGSRLPTGIADIDAPTGGGLPTAALTELTTCVASSGTHLMLGQLLAATRRAQQRAALVDPANRFDPESYPAIDLAHLVWARGGDVATALSVTDLFARDANLGLVVLDLRDAATTELRRVPAPLWYRLQRAVEGTELALLVISPRPLVPSASLRLQLNHPLPLAVLEADRPAILPHLNLTLPRLRSTSHARSA
ncbi:MAG: hypothetical protein SynsKO_11780 [Synoicihabitans sp.]